MAEIRNNKIIFDASDWLATLNEKYSEQPADIPIPIGGNRLTAAQGFNPYRFLGYASPGFEYVNVLNSIIVDNTAIRSMTFGAESGVMYGYGINSSTRLFQIDSTTGDLTNAGVWPHSISASGTPQGEDITVYGVNIGGTRVNRLFYSYNDTGNNTWDIGAYSLDGATFDDDWLSTVPVDATGLGSPFGGEFNPHPMIVGDDDVLYIGNGRYVYGLDGATGTNSTLNLSLILPDGFRIKSFARVNQRLAIFGYFEPNSSASPNLTSFTATRSMVYWWDYLSLDPYDSQEIDDNYISCAFEYNGTIGCFSQGRKTVPFAPQQSKLWLYSFGSGQFETVAQFEQNAPIHNSVDVAGPTILWNSQGTVYQYGSPYAGFDNGLNKVAELIGSSSGVVKTINTTTQLISSGTGEDGGLQKVSNSFDAECFVTTAVASPLWNKGKRGRATKLTVEFAKTSSGGRNLDIILVSNSFSSAVTVANNINTVDSTNIISMYSYDVNGNKLPAFNDLALLLRWETGTGSSDAPVVKRVVVEYEEETNTTST